ncbi:uncharacterized protein LOC105829445 [Monomorium pharaonis]|uniref:uncharacterized protein LOC105829445 n=1 Tax=Monomorium pharaonis TaxID=307658 RepID=UPI00063F4F45|nr:uncharacterized protein LOC105829445 [Monomorium pharaonis]
MAKRKSFNRIHGRNSRHRSNDSFGSGFLDPDTNIVDEGRTFWWNNLEEDTSPRHSHIYSVNETPGQLNERSELNSTYGSMEWWKNLEASGSKSSISMRRNLSAEIVKANILQVSTSESEKESMHDLRKKKVYLKATNSRKSINNAFSKALNETETTIPLNLRGKRVNYSEFHSDLDKDVSPQRENLQEDEEDSNLSATGNILKLKPTISRRTRRNASTDDQNPFQDVLTEGVLSGNVTRKSIALQKESSRRSMHGDIDTNKDCSGDHGKSMRASQAIPLESINAISLNLPPPNVEDAASEANVEVIVQDTDESTEIAPSQFLKRKFAFGQRTRRSVGKNAFTDALADDSSSSLSDLNEKQRKSTFLQRTRKSVGKNAFADALADNSSLNLSDLNKENDFNEAPLMSLSPLRPSKELSINRSKNNITLEKSPIRQSSRLSLSAAKKQSLNIQDVKNNIEAVDLSSSSTDNKSLRRKIFEAVSLKPTSKILENSRKSLTKEPNPFEEILRKDGNISTRESHVSTEDNHGSLEQDRSTIKIIEVRGAVMEEENLQSKEDEVANEEESEEISVTSLNVEENVPKKLNVSLELRDTQLANSDLANISKSSSRKSIVATTSEKQASFSRKSIRKSPLEEHSHTNTMLSVGRSSTNKIITHAIVNDDVHNDVAVEQDLSTPKRVSKLINPFNKELRVVLTRISLRNRPETPKQSASKNTQLPKRSLNWINEEDDDVSVDSEINIGSVSEIISSTRISKVSTNNIERHKSTITPAEMADDTEEPARQTIQPNSTLTRAETSNKIVDRQSVQISNRTSIRENREIGRKDKSSSKSQNSRMSIKPSTSKGISVSKVNSSLKKIDDFFKIKQTSIAMDQSSQDAQRSQVFEKMEKIKSKLERIKSREMAAMKIAITDEKKSTLQMKKYAKSVMLKQTTKKKLLAKPMKVVDKAFLVNGKVYRAPRLPRPKHWVTDRFYKFLWNRMEPKYKLAARVKSEKFVQELAKIVAIIERRKKYESYKTEMDALMKEMARLNIINTRNDFYHFCQDFLPYEFRVKVVPMLMPGNKNNIPYDPEKLHVPILDTE